MWEHIWSEIRGGPYLQKALSYLGMERGNPGCGERIHGALRFKIQLEFRTWLARFKSFGSRG